MSHSEMRRMAHEAMALLPSPFLRTADGRHAVRDGIALNALKLPGPSFNYAAVLDVEHPLHHVVQIADEFFGTKPGTYGVLVEGDAGHPLEAELRRNGWQVFEDEPALIRPSLNDIESTHATHPDLTIGVVQDRASLDAFGRLVARAFEAPPELESATSISDEMAADPDVAILLGYEGDVPVSAVEMLRTGPYAVIAGTSTEHGHRGRGYGAAVTMAALLEGRRRGCTAGALRSGPKSMPLYQRLGFQLVCQHRTYVPPGGRE